MSAVHDEIAVVKPFRLDLTVSVLRRSSTNIVDIFTADGHYVRALGADRHVVVVRARQERPGVLAVTLISPQGEPVDRVHVLATLQRVLGIDRDLSPFNRAARDIAWLQPIAARMRGVKPPRYPTLWEACVNAIVFQQVSLLAASAVARRMIMALGAPFQCGAVTVHAFPTVESLQAAGDAVLRAAGLSANKIATLRRTADALQSGMLDEEVLQLLPSADAWTLLRRIKGIGPWTATVILLRGLGRLDVFPMNDSGVARTLVFAADAAVDLALVLAALGPQKGMLYYHLLLARLEARGELGCPSA